MKTDYEIWLFQKRNFKIYANKHNSNLLASQKLGQKLEMLKHQTYNKL
jgi:hypothetical protein